MEEPQIPVEHGQVIEPTPVTAPPPTDALAVNKSQIDTLTAEAGILAQQVASGANWFYWIAGLSVVNTVVLMSNGKFNFVIGLGITQVVDGIGSIISGNGKIITLAISLLIAAIFALFGYFSVRRHSWAFITGLVLYLLDGVIFLFVKDWLPIAFHAWALFAIFKGFQANNQLQLIEHKLASLRYQQQQTIQSFNS